MAEKHQCSVKVWRGWDYHPCSRNAKIQRDGQWFCFQHDPVAVKARDKASQDRMEAQLSEIRRRSEQSRRADAYPALVEALRKIATTQNDKWVDSGVLVARAYVSEEMRDIAKSALEKAGEL